MKVGLRSSDTSLHIGSRTRAVLFRTCERWTQRSLVEVAAVLLSWQTVNVSMILDGSIKSRHTWHS